MQKRPLGTRRNCQYQRDRDRAVGGRGPLLQPQQYVSALDWAHSRRDADDSRHLRTDPPEFHYLLDQAEQEVRELGVCQPIEKEFLRLDGSRVSFLLSASLLNKRCAPWWALVTDLRERRCLSASPPPSKRRP